MTSAEFGALAMTQLLLEYGADVNAVDRDGWTALHWAAHAGEYYDAPEVVVALLDAGADISMRTYKSKSYEVRGASGTQTLRGHLNAPWALKRSVPAVSSQAAPALAALYPAIGAATPLACSPLWDQPCPATEPSLLAPSLATPSPVLADHTHRIPPSPLAARHARRRLRRQPGYQGGVARRAVLSLAANSCRGEEARASREACGARARTAGPDWQRWDRTRCAPTSLAFLRD